jgi:hypothetical protein
LKRWGAIRFIIASKESRLKIMRARFSIIIALLFCFLFVSKIDAQFNLQKDKIPEDLLITLKRQEGGGGANSEITITANGDWSYQESRRGLSLVPAHSDSLLNGNRVNPPKYLKPELSVEKLKLLIAEFEKIQFFKFGKEFPQESEKENRVIPHRATEVISMRINGQTKEVSNYLGESLKRTKLLRDLAERIRGAGVWNYENGEIPENFEVRYAFSNGDDLHYKEFKIESNGKVTETIFSNKSSTQPAGKTLSFSEKSKTVGILSKPQLLQLIDEFEKGVFSTFKYSPLSKYSGCANEPNSPTEKRTHIAVQINRASQMYASSYENCNPAPETDAAKFEYINNVLRKLLKNFSIVE